MKKTLTILALLLLVAIQAQSQTHYRTYLIRSGPYNQQTREFDLEETQTQLLITMENSVVRVRDDAHSTYITRNPRLEREDQKIKSVIWEAIDEKGREVSIMVIEHRDTGRWSIAVLYPGYMIQYFIVKELE